MAVLAILAVLAEFAILATDQSIHSITNYLLMDIKEIIIVHHHIYSTVDMWTCGLFISRD